MAIDSAAKRRSAVNVGSPWRGLLPVPDASIDQGDRQTVALMYSGILAGGAAVIATPSAAWRLLSRQTIARLPTRATIARLVRRGALQ